MRTKFIYLLLVFLAFTSCHEDLVDSSENTDEETQVTLPLVFTEIEGDLIGYIYDNENNPISDAEVFIYSGSTTTNEFGVFEFQDVKMDGQGTYVQVTKSGFIDGSVFVFPNDNGSGTARLKLLKSNVLESFNSAEGGQVSFGEEGAVIFSPNSIVLPSGSSYSGQVDVDLIFSSPNNTEYGEGPAVGFIGKDELGRNRALGSYGSIRVSLIGSENENVKVKSDGSFNIKFPIDSDLLAVAEEEIIVWKLDPSNGYWVEVGVATKADGFYITTVSEIGHYLFADSYKMAHFCGRLVDNAELPISNYSYNIFVNERLSGSGVTDNDGFICSKLPANENLILEIIHPYCKEIKEYVALDPIADVLNIGDVAIDIKNELRTGSVTCDGDLVSDVLIVIKKGDETVVQLSDQNGAFTINMENVLCNENEEFSLFAIRGEEVSPTIVMSLANEEDLMLELCKSECEFTVSFLSEKADYCSSGYYDVLTVVTDGGSGQYTYQWQNGENTETISSVEAGSDVCVIVTEVSSGCKVTYCDQPAEYNRLSLTSTKSFHNNCEQNGGQIEVSLVGGVEPYIYQWTGDGGYLSSERSPTGLYAGTYEVTVTDFNGCEVYSISEVFDVNVPLTSDILEYCDYSLIRLIEDPGYSPYIYEWEGGVSLTNELEISEPGTYSVSVTDQSGCSRSKSFEIFSVGTEVILNTSYNCEVSEVLFNATSLDYEYFFETVLNSERTNLEIDGGKLSVPILESGYRFSYGAVDLEADCYNTEFIELPHFEGLEADVNNTSCVACNDGFVSVFLDNNQECTGGCETGEVIIIDKLTSEDVTEQNEQSELSSGEYIIIVTDANNGCYIAHEEVRVE